jgi:hypothetical protein
MCLKSGIHICTTDFKVTAYQHESLSEDISHLKYVFLQKQGIDAINI